MDKTFESFIETSPLKDNFDNLSNRQKKELEKQLNNDFNKLLSSETTDIKRQEFLKKAVDLISAMQDQNELAVMEKTLLQKDILRENILKKEVISIWREVDTTYNDVRSKINFWSININDSKSWEKYLDEFEKNYNPKDWTKLSDTDFEKWKDAIIDYLKSLEGLLEELYSQKDRIINEKDHNYFEIWDTRFKFISKENALVWLRDAISLLWNIQEQTSIMDNWWIQTLLVIVLGQALRTSFRRGIRDNVWEISESKKSMTKTEYLGQIAIKVRDFITWKIKSKTNGIIDFTEDKKVVNWENTSRNDNKTFTIFDHEELVSEDPQERLTELNRRRTIIDFMKKEWVPNEKLNKLNKKVNLLTNKTFYNDIQAILKEYWIFWKVWQEFKLWNDSSKIIKEMDKKIQTMQSISHKLFYDGYNWDLLKLFETSNWLYEKSKNSLFDVNNIDYDQKILRKKTLELYEKYLHNCEFNKLKWGWNKFDLDIAKMDIYAIFKIKLSWNEKPEDILNEIFKWKKITLLDWYEMENWIVRKPLKLDSELNDVKRLTESEGILPNYDNMNLRWEAFKKLLDKTNKIINENINVTEKHANTDPFFMNIYTIFRMELSWNEKPEDIVEKVFKWEKIRLLNWYEVENWILKEMWKNKLYTIKNWYLIEVWELDKTFGIDDLKNEIEDWKVKEVRKYLTDWIKTEAELNSKIKKLYPNKEDKDIDKIKEEIKDKLEKSINEFDDYIERKFNTNKQWVTSEDNIKKYWDIDNLRKAINHNWNKKASFKYMYEWLASDIPKQTQFLEKFWKDALWDIDFTELSNKHKLGILKNDFEKTKKITSDSEKLNKLEELLDKIAKENEGLDSSNAQKTEYEKVTWGIKDEYKKALDKVYSEAILNSKNLKKLEEAKTDLLDTRKSKFKDYGWKDEVFKEANAELDKALEVKYTEINTTFEENLKKIGVKDDVYDIENKDTSNAMKERRLVWEHDWELKQLRKDLIDKFWSEEKVPKTIKESVLNRIDKKISWLKTYVDRIVQLDLESFARNWVNQTQNNNSLNQDKKSDEIKTEWIKDSDLDLILKNKDPYNYYYYSLEKFYWIKSKELKDFENAIDSKLSHKTTLYLSDIEFIFKEIKLDISEYSLLNNPKVDFKIGDSFDNEKVKESLKGTFTFKDFFENIKNIRINWR